MIRLFALIAVLGFVASPVHAAPAATPDRPTRAEIWDLKLGSPARELPDLFVDYACGNNGGPPSVPLSHWREFARCRPESSGLREIYFRYDDELEYWAKANDFATEIEQYSGTKVFNFPVVLSGLFDASGVLVGLRIISDSRDTSKKREEAYTLRNFLTARYGRDGWTCVDAPPVDGEGPVGRTFIKQTCRKTTADRGAARLTTHYLRKKGQAEFDPHTGRQTEGQFESLVRFELISR